MPAMIAMNLRHAKGIRINLPILYWLTAMRGDAAHSLAITR
jgi:hypothetical protein